jgi:hypothetical protein
MICEGVPFFLSCYKVLMASSVLLLDVGHELRDEVL